MRHGYGKWIVREGLRGMIPEQIRAARYKSSFDISQAVWIEQGLGAAIRRGLHERWAKMRDWLQADLNIEEVFSNRQLSNRPLAFAEAVTLLWLGNRVRS